MPTRDPPRARAVGDGAQTAPASGPSEAEITADDAIHGVWSRLRVSGLEKNELIFLLGR